MPEHILITGGSGFIGSHMVDHLLVNTDWNISVLDSLTYAGDIGKLATSEHFNSRRVSIHWHDLNAPIMESLDRRIRKWGDIDYIVNMASASHIDQSILDPVPFVKNNVTLALHMLDYARGLKQLRVFCQLSTDEIYGAVESGVTLPEWSTINPSNPYSASKSAQDCIAIGFWRTYGVPVIIPSLMNNFGERQDSEKFVPKIVKSLLNKSEIILHGTEEEPGSRFYLHARNAADAILFLLHRTPSRYPKSERPDRYNVVGDRRVDNWEMALRVSKIAGIPLKYRFDHNPRSRPGHDLHYGLDGSKLASLGWKAPVQFEASLEKTVRWMINNPEW